MIIFRENMSSFFLIFKYLSCVNYGYNSIMINQWGKVQTLNCEYDEPLQVLCIENGKSILEDLDLSTVYEFNMAFSLI